MYSDANDPQTGNDPQIGPQSKVWKAKFRNLCDLFAPEFTTEVKLTILFGNKLAFNSAQSELIIFIGMCSINRNNNPVLYL